MMWAGNSGATDGSIDCDKHSAPYCLAMPLVCRWPSCYALTISITAEGQYVDLYCEIAAELEAYVAAKWRAWKLELP